MTISCEMFMDCVYEEDIAMEGVHPIYTLKKICRRIIDEIMKLINRLRGLRKIVIPIKHLNEYMFIENTICNIFETFDPKTDVNTIIAAMNKLASTDIYKSFFAAEKKNTSLLKKDFFEYEKTNEVITALNYMIDELRKYTDHAANPESSEDDKKMAQTMARLCTMRIKLIHKLLSFSAPRKDPKNIQSLDAPINAKVNIV